MASSPRYSDEDVAECRRVGKANYILKILHQDFIIKLKDIDFIAGKLYDSGNLSEQELNRTLSVREGSTRSKEEVFLDILYRKQEADINAFWDLLRHTNQFELVSQIEQHNRRLDIQLQNDHGGEVATQYHLPATVPSAHKDDSTVNINQFNADIIATTDGIVRLIRRGVWGAMPSRGEMGRLKRPIQYVIFTHTASIGAYMTTLECVQACKQAQDLHFSWGWSDIGYNLLVGNDGAIYEGRGLEYEGATAKGWNTRCLGVAFIGKYVERVPSEDALDVTRSYLQYLVDEKVLSRDFTIHCLRQVRENFPQAPGDPLYDIIKKWKGVTPNTWAWRETEDEEINIPVAPDQRLSEQHQKNLKEQTEFFAERIVTPARVLNKLVSKEVLTSKVESQILKKSRSDADVTRLLLECLVSGKRSWFPVYIEVLLQSNQRLLAKLLYKTLPRDERGWYQRPKIKLKSAPQYKEIPANEIVFDKPYGAAVESNSSNRSIVELGAGSFGVVQLATYTQLGDAKVAFKRVKGSEYGGMNDRDLKDFKKEAAMMYNLRHPDIVTIYGTVCDASQHVYGIVMEYMEIGSLDDLVNKIYIPWSVKTRMLRDVCRGLVFLNTPQPPDRPYPVTHCDIKARNILVNDRFGAKIADFGEATLQNITTRSLSSKSSADTTHGTVTHMAPELLNPPDDMYDPTEKSDVWSFGITVFEICAENTKGTAERRTPFPKKMKNMQITYMIGLKMESPITPEQMTKIPEDCPNFLCDLMHQCCVVDRNYRLDFRGVSTILEENYEREFKDDIHPDLSKVHVTYAKDVLNLVTSFSSDEDDDTFYTTDTDSDASGGNLPRKERKRESRIKQIQELKELLASLQDKIVDQTNDIIGLRSTIGEVLQANDSLKQELELAQNPHDCNLIVELKQEMDVITQSVTRSIQEARENQDTERKRELNEMEERLNERISDVGKQIARITVCEEYEFSNPKLREHFTSLIEDMDVLDDMFEDVDLLSFDDYERIRSQVTTKDKNRLLLQFIDMKGDHGFKVLQRALAKHRNMEHLSDMLKT